MNGNPSTTFSSNGMNVIGDGKSNDHFLHLNKTLPSSFILECDVTNIPTSGSSAGLMCNNVFTENTGSDSVVNDFNGNQTRHSTLYAPFSLKFITQNDTITIYKDGVLQSTMTNNTNVYSGFYVKLYQSRQITFKNLKITEL